MHNLLWGFGTNPRTSPALRCYLEMQRQDIQHNGAQLSLGTREIGSTRVSGPRQCVQLKSRVDFEIFRHYALPFKTIRTADGDIRSSFARCFMVAVNLFRSYFPMADIIAACKTGFPATAVLHMLYLLYHSRGDVLRLFPSFCCLFGLNFMRGAAAVSICTAQRRYENIMTVNWANASL